MKIIESVRLDTANVERASDTRVTRSVRIPIRGYQVQTDDDYLDDAGYPRREDTLAVVRVSSYGDPSARLVAEMFIDCNRSMTYALSKAIAEAIPIAWAEWGKAFGDG